ncbi:hypothetical protein GQX74_011879 [Glossina fuscipes]|nr:hypothetical protein GQX74_011879 [Glossina fuscipes]
MELLSNSCIPKQMASASSNNTGSNLATTNGSAATTERLLAGILDTFPSWNMGVGMGGGAALIGNNGGNGAIKNNSPSRQDYEYFYNNFHATNEFGIGPLAGLGGAAVNSISGGSGGGGGGGGVGVGMGAGMRPKISPDASNNSTINCGWCDVNASIRCLECNEFMCNDCLREHRKSSLSSNHSIVSLPRPIGTSPTSAISNNMPVAPAPSYLCDQHNEILRYVCESCKKVVCQFCTLHEHKEHCYSSIQSFVEDSREKIEAALESGRMGTTCIKSGIDKALLFIRHIEKNCVELSDNIRKAFRQFIIAVEDRERFLLEFVEKLRQRRLATLHEQMAGLKSALAGLAETSDMLNKVAENGARLDLVDVAMKVTNGQRQLEQFAAIYKDLQPKEETFAFVIPDYSLLHDIRNQGGIIVVDENVPAVNNTVGNIATSGVGSEPVIPAAAIPNGSSHSVGQGAIRRPFVHDISYRIPSPSVVPPRGGSACGMPSHGHDWELSVIPNSPCLHFGAPRSTPAIPGAIEPVKARNSRALSLSFATEGHEDGQVSRPWGLCVDRIGHILVSDRRNNRVQVFNPNGSLKFKFGRKGVGNGEFDLPAGICVDIDNRIIVVDKDNHRVQIFTSSGVFLLKFGSYGKEYGQFQYPWDVAVNSRRQIVVTDSRNHRIQQFDSDGRFIRQIVFDNVGQNKGIASPRGVCYTPTGNIIVSDFDNHCLYLIDPDKNEILSAKGHEGSGVQEFNRPSGLCCDDEGRIIIADSKNQRIVVYSPTLDYLWGIDIRPYMNPFMPPTLDEKDRTCDVALMPDGRIVFLIELSPDSKEGSNPYKRFVHIF